MHPKGQYMKPFSRILPTLIAPGILTLGLFVSLIAHADCVTPPAGLVGWWKGNGNTVDSIAANNGVNQNAGFSSGVVSQAFAFDPENLPYGTYSGIQIADQPAYALTNSLTIEGWVRPRGDGYLIFWRGDNRPGIDPYYLSMQANNTLRFGICDAGGNSAFVDTTLNYFAWTHVAATLDGSSGALRIYTNGVLAAQTVTAIRPFGDLIPGQSPGVGIGNLNDGGNNFPFLGDIDEISLYNRALSAGEIQAIYNAGSAGKCTPVVQTNTCVTPPSGLVAGWPGENNANEIIEGTAGTLYPGTSFATGEVGQAFAFDGVAGCVMNPDMPAMTGIQDTFTMEFWAYPQKGFDIAAESGDGYPGISGQSYAIFPDWGGLDGQAGVGVSVGTNGISVIEHAHNYMPSVLSYTNPITGWTHITVVYKNKQPTLYVNGVNVRTGITSSRSFVYPSKELGNSYGSVFGHAFNTYGPYAGLLDEIAIYSRALAPAEIQSIYNAGSAGKCVPATTPPVVAAALSFTPASATNGATITISGTNFSATAAENIVYFGAVRAIVTSASLTNLMVTVPVGATFAPITVTVNGLTTYSTRPFLPTFVGTGAGISTASFGPRQNLESGNGPIQVVIADLDNDGKPDLIVANDYNNTISLYRNISTDHTLTAASFAPPVDLATPTGSYSPYGIVAADVDGDGKLDIIATDFIDQNVVSVYRNTCTPGDISAGAFATRVDFPTGPNPQGVAVGDIDGDGRTDLLVANTGDGTVSILRNTSVVGSLTAGSFAAKVDFATGGGCDNVTVGDLDGDGRPDVATANGGGTVSLLRNISSPGSLAFDTKADFATADGALHVKLVDLDGDGKLDLIVECYLPQTMSVFRNTSTAGSLTVDSLAPRIDFALGGRGHTTAVGDLDGDGKPDLAVATELDSLISIFQNNGTPGSFTDSSLAGRVDFSTGWNAWGVTVGDLDGDGRPDVVFANSYDHNISIYQNQSPIAGNHPPVADATATIPLVISLNNSNALVILDGSLSSDPDGDTLQYAWSMNNAAIASGMVAVTMLPVGTNSITLSVNDGLASGQQTIAVAVITTSQAVQQLLDLVNSDVAKAKSLAATLSAAIKAIDRSKPATAINQLQAFQNQVRAQIMPLDPLVADMLINDAQDIIDALTAGGAPKDVKINNAARKANGKLHLNFSAPHGSAYIIEASTNLVDWQKIGVGKVRDDGTFEFDDTDAMRLSKRFYRILSP
jgi:hypothetical protein